MGLFMIQDMLNLLAQIFLGKGIDKKFPFLVDLYKKVYSIVVKEGEVKVTIPLGLKLFVSSKDCGLGMFLRTKGEFEPVQTKLFLESLKSGDTVFDIGANVGYYTVLASKKVGNKGKVYAFEPDPANLRLLRKNIELNKCSNVQVVESAVDERNDTAVLTLDEANPGENSLSRQKAGREILVKTITLDTFIRKEKIIKVDAIKVDIEGAEIGALMGGRKFFRQAKKVQLFIECNQNTLIQFNKTSDDLINMLKNLGFRLQYIVNESEKTISAFTNQRLKEELQKIAFVGLIAQK